MTSNRHSYFSWMTWVCFIGGLANLLSCKPANSPVSPQVQTQTPSNPFPSGELMDPVIGFQLAVYYVPEPSKDPLGELDSLINSHFPELKRVEVIDKNPSHPEVTAKLVLNPRENYPPPPLDLIQFSERGISQEQANALQESQKVLVLTFAHPKDQVWEGLINASMLVLEMAQSTGGLIWDDESREVFSTEQWKTRRVSNWDGKVPHIPSQIAIHAYAEEGLVREITLGMAKFGLPDIVIEESPKFTSSQTASLINLLAQAVAERPMIPKVGEYDLDIQAIKHTKERDALVSSLKSNATGKALLSLRQGEWDEGDPLNRLIEVTFDHGSGTDAQSRMQDLVSQLFGSEDSVTTVQHDDELMIASRRSREKLPVLRKVIEDGLEPGEVILVKAPFKTQSGGKEWMWVEVVKWQNDKIVGLLQNDPFEIPELKAGQSVDVSEADVFDYIHVLKDGTMEGNETGKIIEKSAR